MSENFTFKGLIFKALDKHLKLLVYLAVIIFTWKS